MACFYKYDDKEFPSLSAIEKHIAYQAENQRGSESEFTYYQKKAAEGKLISTIGSIIKTDVLDTKLLPALRSVLERTRVPISEIPIYVNNTIDAGGVFVSGTLNTDNELPFIVVKDKSSEQFKYTILHEIIHAYTHGVLAEPKSQLRTANEIEFREKIEKLYEFASKESFAQFGQSATKFYGLTNISEFVAEAVSNTEFRAWLKETKIDDESFFQKLVSAILDLFGVNESDVLALTEQAIEDYLNNKSDIVYIYNIEDGLRVAYSNKNIWYTEYHGEKMFTKADKDEETGNYKKEGQEFKSITGSVIPMFQSRPFSSEKTVGERAADAIWGTSDPNERKFVDPSVAAVEVTRDEFVKIVDAQVELGKARGTIFHKLVHYHVSGEADAQKEAYDLMDSVGFLSTEFDWINDKAVRQIIKKTGTTYYQQNGLDKIYSEKTILSKTLGWGGTIDLIIDHGGDIYSLYDMKTGSYFNKMWESSLLKYGNTPHLTVFDNVRNRAKLQLMLYAFMLKVENPNVKFKNLELIHIINRFSISEDDARRGVDVPAYLHIIKRTLENEHKDLWARLQKLEHFKKLFDSSEYVTTSSTDYEVSLPNADAGMILRMKMLELESLVMQNNDLVRGQELKGDDAKERGEKIEELMKQIISLKNDDRTNYASWDTDMGWMERWLGSPTSSTNPYVKLYYKTLSKAKLDHRKEYSAWRERFDAILKKLLAEKGKPVTSWVGGVDREKLYVFAFKQEKSGEEITERFLTPEDAEWNKLSTTEKEFLNFVNESVEQFFVDSKSNYVDERGKRVALANRVVTYRKKQGREQPITNLQLHNNSYDKSSYARTRQPFKWYNGFMPKVPPTLDDVKTKYGLFSKETIRLLRNQHLTNFFEANFEGWYSTDEAIPMKYLGNARINSSGNYSHNVELIVDSFVKQHLYKQHLDSVYAFGKAMQYYLHAKENADQNVYFNNLKDWFEDSVNLHILGKKADSIKLSGREFGIIRNNHYEQINWIKVLRAIKNFFIAPTMWIKPVTGTINAVFANLVTIKEAVRNSIPGWHAGSNFDVADLAFGYKEALNLYTVDALQDSKFRRNKAYILMERFGYMPDSFDWFTLPNQLLTAKNKLFTSRTMMLFHTLPEEVLATAMFVAQLKATKFTKADGTKTNVWDAYSDSKPVKLSSGEEVYTVEWLGGVRGKRNVSNIEDKPLWEEVTEYTQEEINNTKFLYEKIHGGYRADERIAAEYHIFGELIFQLKKYFPSILKNVWASRGVRDTQGFFEESTNEKGEKILKWTPQVIEGRYRMLFGMFFNYMGLLGKTNGNKETFLNFFGYRGDETYKWSELSATQKEDMYDFFLTSTIFLAMLFGYKHMWEPQEEDTFKKAFDRIKNDFAGYVYPLELMKNLVNLSQPIAGRKALKLAEGSTEFFWSGIMYSAGYTDEALTKQGRLRGWTEVERNMPFLASWHDLHKAILESEDLQYIMDERFK